jgi:hypothetical protein
MAGAAEVCVEVHARLIGDGKSYIIVLRISEASLTADDGWPFYVTAKSERCERYYDSILLGSR